MSAWASTIAPTLTHTEARELTDQIISGIVDAVAERSRLDMIKEAYLSGSWRSKYATWEDWCTAELGMQPRPRRNADADRRSVYFLRDLAGGLIKIGVAVDPAARLRQIQHMSPVRLEIIGVIPGVGQVGESDLHQRFAASRAHGEWFQPTPELLDFIRQHSTPAGAR